MNIVTVSSKFQIVIPQMVRLALSIEPGEKLQVISYNGQIRLVPVKPLKSLRGAYRGVGSRVERDADRV